MPVIPLPPGGSNTQGGQQARSIPELSVRANPDAFGANVADVNYRGNLQLMQAEAAAGAAENRMITGAISGVMKLAGDVWQRDQKLEAEANLQDLSMGIERDSEGQVARGDGSLRTQTLKAFDERAQRLVEGAQTPFQRSIYEEGIQRQRFQIEKAAVSREVAAVKQQREDQLNKLAEAAELEVFKDPAAMQSAHARLTAQITESNLTPSQRQRLQENVTKRLHAIAIEKHMVSGRIGDAQRLLSQDATVNALGALEVLRMQSRVNKAAEAEADKQASIERNKRLLMGTELIDPANSEHRKLIDDAFTATGADKALAAGNADAVTMVSGIVKRYGVVPPSAIGLINGMVLNGTPEQQIFWLQAINSFEAAKPGSVPTDGAHKTLRSEADDFRFLTAGTTGLGLPPDEALKRIHDRRTPEFKAKAEARRDELKNKDGPLSRRTDAELVQVFDDAWFSDPKIGNPRDRGVLLGTYRKAFEEHYVRTGDEANAIAAAKADVQRVYGVTRQSGPESRVVRNPIEQRYPAIDGSHDYIRRQLADAIKEKTGKTINPGDLYMESTRATEEALSRGGVRTGNPPPYAFYWMEKGKDGVERTETIPGMLFTPDVLDARRRATDNAQTLRNQRAVGVGTEPGTMTGFTQEPEVPASRPPLPGRIGNAGLTNDGQPIPGNLEGKKQPEARSYESPLWRDKIASFLLTVGTDGPPSEFRRNAVESLTGSVGAGRTGRLSAFDVAVVPSMVLAPNEMKQAAMRGDWLDFVGAALAIIPAGRPASVGGKALAREVTTAAANAELGKALRPAATTEAANKAQVGIYTPIHYTHEGVAHPLNQPMTDATKERLRTSAIPDARAIGGGNTASMGQGGAPNFSEWMVNTRTGEVRSASEIPGLVARYEGDMLKREMTTVGSGKQQTVRLTPEQRAQMAAEIKANPDMADVIRESYMTPKKAEEVRTDWQPLFSEKTAVRRPLSAEEMAASRKIWGDPKGEFWNAPLTEAAETAAKEMASRKVSYGDVLANLVERMKSAGAQSDEIAAQMPVIMAHVARSLAVSSNTGSARYPELTNESATRSIMDLFGFGARALGAQ